MDSIICDEKYEKYELEKMYDKIIAFSVEELFYNSTYNKGEICIKYEKDNINDEYLLQVAKICNSVGYVPIRLRTDLLTYLKLKKKHKNYTIKRVWTKKKWYWLRSSTLMHSIQVKFTGLDTTDLFKRIYETFWIGQKEEEEIDV